jgi:hypothetical protein
VAAISISSMQAKLDLRAAEVFVALRRALCSVLHRSAVLLQ